MDWQDYESPYGPLQATTHEGVAVLLHQGVHDVIARARRQRWPGASRVSFPPRTAIAQDACTSAPRSVLGYASSTWTLCADGAWFWVWRVSGDEPTRHALLEARRRRTRAGSIWQDGGDIRTNLPARAVPDATAALYSLAWLVTERGVSLDAAPRTDNWL